MNISSRYKTVEVIMLTLFVKQMKESNKMYYTGTRDDLISRGYDPCGNCHRKI